MIKQLTHIHKPPFGGPPQIETKDETKETKETKEESDTTTEKIENL